ncbi:MAG: hypothetical protein HY698_22735 [Deltaproteobacteria bacterium]|nr:hypothetical protein [Deltaproteobacteria bacterium]
MNSPRAGRVRGVTSADNAQREEVEWLLAPLDLEEGAVVIEVPCLSRTKRQVIGSVFPSHELLAMVRVLTQHMIPTCAVGLGTESGWEDFNQALSRFRTPLACLLAAPDCTAEDLLATCRLVRQRKPRACIAVLGVPAASQAEWFLREGGADMVLGHDGTDALDSLYSYLRRETTDLPMGITFAGSSGQLVATPARLIGRGTAPEAEPRRKVPFAS